MRMEVRMAQYSLRLGVVVLVFPKLISELGERVLCPVTQSATICE